MSGEAPDIFRAAVDRQADVKSAETVEVSRRLGLVPAELVGDGASEPESKAADDAHAADSDLGDSGSAPGLVGALDQGPRGKAIRMPKQTLAERMDEALRRATVLAEANPTFSPDD